MEPWYVEAKQLNWEFERWWMGRAKEAPLVDAELDFATVSNGGSAIDRIKSLCRQFFGFGYEQRKQDEAGLAGLETAVRALTATAEGMNQDVVAVGSQELLQVEELLGIPPARPEDSGR